MIDDMTGIETWLANLRMRVLPPEEHGWVSLWSLVYLFFLFLNWDDRVWTTWLPPTLLSLAVFLPLYLLAIRDRSRQLACAAAIAVLGFALTPINTGANTYLIYAGALVGASGVGLRLSLRIIIALLALYALELWLCGWPQKAIVLTVMITGLLALAIGVANHFQREKRLRQAELKLSHDEVRRLAALAERERIGRDLHDLLGHTLSLITIKSELAVKLFDRDTLAARREIVDVERVARDALGQVRRAVSGIRTAGFAAELASARLLLESSDIRLDYNSTDVPLPPQIETVLALTVREAVTNIQRHAQARAARIALCIDAGEAQLVIEDDGRAAKPVVPGNGLSGMRERLQMLGGHLEIESARGQGTRLVAGLPLSPEAGGVPGNASLA